MKPDSNLCKMCGVELDGKANKEFCSDAHRMAFKRKNVRLNEPNPNKPEHLPEQTEQIANPNTGVEPEQSVENHGEIQNDDNPNKWGVDRSKLTKCDKTFYDRAMKHFERPYYNFNGNLRKEKCAYCGADYTTNLSLNKYCSYQHYEISLHATKR